MAARSAQKREESNARSALIWGSLAFCSILVVCTVIALRIGTTGGELVTARINTTPPPQKIVVQKPQGASEFEVARLNDAIRALAAERDRLAARVETLEQSVGDITASINTAKKTASAPPPPAETPKEIEKKPVEMARTPETPPAPAPVVAAAPPPAAAPAEAPAKPAASQTPVFSVRDLPEQAGEKPAEKPATSRAVRTPTAISWFDRPNPVRAHTQKTTRTHAAKAAPPAAAPNPPPIPPARPAIAASNGPATQVAQILPNAQPQQGLTDVTGATKTEFGLDLGGETSLDGLRARWAAIKGKHREALEGLQPLVRVREGSRPGTVELHLIAGPVSNAGTAARVCAKLQASGLACQASEFDGQRLSVR
jgi:hypothetical protein